MKRAPGHGAFIHKFLFISGNFYFSFVSTSSADINIPKNKRKTKITRDTKLTTTELFLTAQTENPPRFPLHVSNESIADKHPINIQIFCSKLRFRFQGILCIISAFKIRSGTQLHGCTDLSTLCTDKSHTYLPLSQIVCL